MGVKTLIPTSNIYDYDIQDTLNANGGKVASWEDMFKAAANINPWSKHKPVALRVNFVQDFSPSGNHYYEGWWRGVDNLCGFDLSAAKTSGFATLVGLYDGGNNGWNYVPVYGQGTPLRQNDFAQYKPSAEPLVKEFSAPSEAYETDDTKTAYITSTSNADSLTLGWNDFPVLKDYYFGILLYKSSSDWQRITASSTVGNGGLSVAFDPTKLILGTYTIYPFLCNNKYTSQSQTDSGGNIIYTLPKVAKTTIVIKSAAITILVSAQTDDSTRSITVSFSVTNGSNSDITLNNNVVKLRSTLKDFDDEFDAEEKETYLDNGLVAKAKSTTSFDGCTFSNIDSTLYASCRVWVSLSSGLYKSYKDIVDIDAGDKE